MGGIWIWYTGIHRGSAQTALSSQACLKYSQNFEIFGTQAYTGSAQTALSSQVGLEFSQNFEILQLQSAISCILEQKLI